MTAAAPSPEAALCAAYREQAALYRQAAALAEQDGLLDAVWALVAEAAAIEERIGPAKESWTRRGDKPGPELRAVLADVAQRIGHLTRRLGEAEREALARQRELVPQLDALIRARAMRAAYNRDSCSVK
jgi:hypothetical protein